MFNQLNINELPDSKTLGVEQGQTLDPQMQGKRATDPSSLKGDSVEVDFYTDPLYCWNWAIASACERLTSVFVNGCYRLNAQNYI
jgi:hypothetical protein